MGQFWGEVKEFHSSPQVRYSEPGGSLPLFSVQYHPEASPGPHDARYLFGQFLNLMATHNRA